MKIDAKTPYSLISECDRYDLLTDESKRQITEAAERMFGSPWSLTINELSQLINGDFSRLGDMTEPTILQVFWAKRFRAFVDEFAKALENLSVPMDADERRANEGLPSVSFVEGLLIFAKNYFRHHSFEQAGRTTLSDIVIAKKDAYRTQMQQRRWNALQREKMRVNGKHHS